VTQASSAEQFILEQINSARKSAGVQPLAFDSDLNTAAENHSSWMLQTGTFSHTGINGTNAGARMTAANYEFTGSWSWGENIAWKTMGSATLQSNALQLHNNLMNSSGHRANILKSSFKEIGVGLVTGGFRDFSNVAMLTEDFAKTGTGSFLTGVAFNDIDKDNSYDIGEGLGGLNVSARNVSTGTIKTTQTTSSGGYQMELSNGTYSVDFGGKVTQVTINGLNVKLDNVTSGAAEQPEQTTNTINGTEARDRLNGTNSADIINGFAGNDVINGRGGSDLLTGGAGRDAFVFDALDGSVDQITDFSNDIIIVDGSTFGSVTFSNGNLASNGAIFVQIVGSFNIETDLYNY
jgi:Ca2+-binding RTX toxin-like protein